MDDVSQRFLFEESQVRGQWVRLSDSYREILSQTTYPERIAQLLGESLVASVMLSSTLKFEGILSIQAQGEGPVRTLMTECTHDGNIRGLARFDEPVSGDSLDELLGAGRMVITISPEQGSRYQGVVPREQDTLAGCLEDYFDRSEQLATSLFLFADGTNAAGLMLQRLPGDAPVDSDLWERANHLAATIKPGELLSLDSETLLHRLFHQETLRLFDPQPIAFQCSCSEERSLAALESVGKDECYRLLEEESVIEMDCQFCHHQYRYDRNHIDRLFFGHSLH